MVYDYFITFSMNDHVFLMRAVYIHRFKNVICDFLVFLVIDYRFRFVKIFLINDLFS